ncbi:restriction endonuclease subunit S [Acinetobacter indicus]|uniref:restriction endonuclease subunit S n=1 Tax=Acinetobacter indicus TaxID=756892 RepID=UPI001443EC81|nr:restriction endonuclease subunit S [Acinetobacter indicus]
MSLDKLPVAWGIAEVGILCDLINGRAFKPSEWSETGLPIIRIQNLNNTRSKFNYFAGSLDDKHKVKKGDLLFAWSGTPGTSFGAHLWYGEDAALNQHIFKIVINEAHIDKSFFRYALNHKLDELILSAQGGVGLRHITKGTFEKTILNYPPLAEQQEIVRQLDLMLAQVEQIKARLDAIPAILKKFRQSVLAEAVSGKLTEEWREVAEFDVDTWTYERAEDLCLKVQSGSTPRNNPFDQNGTIPFLKVYNIVDQKIAFDYKPQFILEDVHQNGSKRSICKPFDILMNIVGPPLGKVAIVTDQYPEWNINQAITMFRVDPEKLKYKFLYYILCEGQIVRDVLHETKGSVGQINISLSQCRDASIPKPSLVEQDVIVERVDSLLGIAEKIENTVQSAQKRVNLLTQSILAKAFSGELTAEWREQHQALITGVNSAESLLAKIQEEREASKPAKKTRKKKEV